jgi:hypothetical protein
MTARTTKVVEFAMQPLKPLSVWSPATRKRLFQKEDRHLEDSEPVPILKQLVSGTQIHGELGTA